MTNVTKTSLLDNLPASTMPDELFETLASGANGVRIERIVSFGHHSPENFWYDQAQAEWVMVVQGEAILAVEGEPDTRLRAGDCLNLPAHKRHRVVWTTPDQPTVWLAVFYS